MKQNEVDPTWLPKRPRRKRKSEAIRTLVRETHLSPSDLVYPLFIKEGVEPKNPIPSMKDCYCYNIAEAVDLCHQVWSKGIPGVALFPKISEKKKDPLARASTDPKGLMSQAIQEIKSALPDLCLFTDVAMDPYSSEGHDGIVKEGNILNDETLEVLAQMALVQAQMGADFVAPSDMMDGRVGFIRKALDSQGFQNTGIMAYSAKYASSFYGPFREALESAPKKGDKKTYQMDPANKNEALKEVSLDIHEGADIVMVKPALSYLDIIQKVKQHSSVPVAAYNVSGEYSMIKAAAERGWLNERSAALEALTSIKRAGADIIFTYWALQATEWL